MRAVRGHVRGGAERLVYEEVATPVPHRGEVLVEVHAAGITFAELGWDLSWQTADGRDRTPVIPAHEVSGVVAGLGPGLDDDLAVGDEVYGLIDFDRDGAAAEFTVVPAAALAMRPRGVSHTEAAALPLAALTAWQALVDHAKVLPGERVLVQGGAGGVGNYVVQLGAALGAEVTAAVRSADREFVTGLGAARVIAYDEDDAVAEAGFDAVVDTVGGTTLLASYGLLRPGGRLVSLTAPPPPQAAAEHGVQDVFFVVSPDREELTRLAELVDEGSLRPVVARTYPLAEGRAAYESGATEHAPGKTVITVRP
ncbi:NADP-dependent oxidoreductase [Catellatospora tritici]|uniref:NADP-dependent oxidoreductase n=1 Tax=Catellatospora tritici TaxID=2851566 RepID=UPI0020C3D705|nr:NADP-dependent oxidoreductase [Catellatospora tritici]